jgi:hypothetical protein
MQLNDSSTARRSAPCKTGCAIAASVERYASIVAMFGWIMPEPLAIPPIVIMAPPILCRNAACLDRVSVVMMALAASSSPPRRSRATKRGNPDRIRAIGSDPPMTPVDPMNT